MFKMQLLLIILAGLIVASILLSYSGVYSPTDNILPFLLAAAFLLWCFYTAKKHSDKKNRRND